MEHSLTAGWTVKSEWPLVISSERNQLSVSLPRDAAVAVAGLMRGWVVGTQPELEPLREALVSRGVLSPMVTWPEAAQSRQIEYWRAFTDDPVAAVKRLRCATVAIIGCGGVGATVLQHLVGGGVEMYRLLDSDVVEESNFNRQFIFSTGSLGSLKVSAAASYVMQRLPTAAVRTIAACWDMTSREQRDFITEGVDMVVAAIDQPSIESSLSVLDVAWAAGVPSIIATVGFEKSLVSHVFDAGRGVLGPRAFLRRSEARQSQPIYASHGPSNTVPATIAADQVLHHLAGIYQRVNYEQPLMLLRTRDGSLESTRVQTVWL